MLGYELPTRTRLRHELRVVLRFDGIPANLEISTQVQHTPWSITQRQESAT
jgi:hypothetical protein